jgi:outer membrane receptor for ferrienterochelin and colicins
MKRLIACLFLCFASGQVSAQYLLGQVLHQGKVLPGAHIQLMPNAGTAISNSEGRFRFNVNPGEYQLRVSYLGFATHEQKLQLRQGDSLPLQIELQSDPLGLSQVVVSANRQATQRREAPVQVEVINQQLMQRLQAPALSDGLSFSAGVRTENNCQNCGFSAVRLNGLPGAYSQILIDGRPVFSALNGVYGLDQIPASMIERIEVVRGGGSVLYGGNAVAGTVNIISREPVDNGFNIWQQSSLIEGRTPENITQFNIDLVDENQTAGISFYGSLRNRGWHDITGDGFSDITQLNGHHLGANAFVKLHKRIQLKSHFYSLEEFRRGGTDFELEPHQTELTEQLQHRLFGLRNDLVYHSADYRHRFTLYNATQHTRRHSYYGGGGRVLQAGDSLTADDLAALNAYGNAEDLSVISGINWHYFAGSGLQITAGTEYWLNTVVDQMPGYGRILDQRYRVWGNFIQGEYALSERWKLMGGLRFDQVYIDGRYDLASDAFTQNQLYPMLLPRLGSMYQLSANSRFRFNYAQGYRAPQAFDEDLHIELVGGSARFVRLSNHLVPERSNSLSAGWEWEQNKGKTAYRSSIEAFFTQLDNPFLLLDAEVLPGGIQVLNKVNGTGARVYGLNFSQQFVLEPGHQLDAGLSLQRAPLLEAEELWSSENADSITSITQLLRTPDWYGFISYRHKLSKNYVLQSNVQLTGPMWVAHMLDPETAYTELVRTPSFIDLSLFIERQWLLSSRTRLQATAGIQNLLNSFQRDLDTGAERDASYVYGPIRPRTYVISLRLIR